MIVKAVTVLISVFTIAFLSSNYEILALSQDVKESCSREDAFNVHFEKSALNKSSCDESENEKNNDDNAGNRTLLTVSCILRGNNISEPVEIVNASKLALIIQVKPNVAHWQVPESCVFVLFYSPSCPFSCMAAPHFNALPRFFPDIRMVAVDAMKYRGFNAQFGVVGTPTLVLFHSGRPVAKFNETSDYNLDSFAEFITKHTGLAPLGNLVVTSSDFSGPISATPVKETDYYLLLSWMVIAARILYSLYHSTWGRSLVDATLNAWREAEAQHHHSD